ncbi:MAG: hypothetical protein WC272_02385 [Sulfurimonas sp.]|jgi:hypothetical protein
MKKIIFLVLFLNSFVFAVPSYTVPIVTYTHIYNSFVSASCSTDVSGHYETTLLINLWGDTECYQRTDSYFMYLSYDTLRDYECSSNGDGTYTVAKSDKSVSGTCNYGCNLTDSICQDRLGDLNATVSSDCTCFLPPPPPSPDTDGDGTPDKCDLDSLDIATLDCDGDGLANNSDGDIDGDGVPNSSDANPLDSANTSSCPSIPSGYILNLSVVDSSSCTLLNPIFTANDGDLFYFKYANWDNCRNQCYTFQTSCPKGQAIKNGECRSVEPDISDCAGTSSCRIIGLGVGDLQSCFKTCNCLTTSSPTPTTENNYFYEEVSCADNQTDKEKLDDLRDNSDVNTSVNNLDINGSVNNDTAASFKAALDSYAGAKETTALSQLKELSLQSLEAVKTNSILDNLKSLAENFFNTSTSNDGVIDGTLKGIKDNTAISNNLLTDIKENGDKVLNNLEGKNSDGTSVDTSFLNPNFADVDSFFTSVQDGFTNISSSYSSLTANIEQGFNYSIPGGTSVATTVNAFGKSITFDISPVLIQLSPIIYYFTYVSMFLLALKIIFLGFMVV